MPWAVSIIRAAVAGGGGRAGADGIHIGTITRAGWSKTYDVMAVGWESTGTLDLGILGDDEDFDFYTVATATALEGVKVAIINNQPCIITCSDGGSSGITIYWVPTSEANFLANTGWTSTRLNGSASAQAYLTVDYTDDTFKTIVAGSRTTGGFTGGIDTWTWVTDPSVATNWTGTRQTATYADWVMEQETHKRTNWNAGAWVITWTNRGLTNPGFHCLVHDGVSAPSTGWTHYTLFSTGADGDLRMGDIRTAPGDSRPTYYLAWNRSSGQNRILMLPEPAAPLDSTPWFSPADTDRWFNIPNTPDIASRIQDVGVLYYTDTDGVIDNVAGTFPEFICSGDKSGDTITKWGTYRVFRESGAWDSENFYSETGWDTGTDKWDNVAIFTKPSDTYPTVYNCEQQLSSIGLGVLEWLNPLNFPPPPITFTRKAYKAGIKRIAEVGVDGIDWVALLVMSESTAGSDDDGVDTLADISVLDEFDGSGYTRTPVTITLDRQDSLSSVYFLCDPVVFTTPGVGTRNVRALIFIDDTDETPIFICPFDVAQTLTAANFTATFTSNRIARAVNPYEWVYMAGIELICTSGLTGADYRAILVMDGSSVDVDDDVGIDTVADFSDLLQADGTNADVVKALVGETSVRDDDTSTTEIHVDDVQFDDVGVGSDPSMALLIVQWDTDLPSSIPVCLQHFTDSLTHDGSDLPITWISSGIIEIVQYLPP